MDGNAITHSILAMHLRGGLETLDNVTNIMTKCFYSALMIRGTLSSSTTTSKVGDVEALSFFLMYVMVSTNVQLHKSGKLYLCYLPSYNYISRGSCTR